MPHSSDLVTEIHRLATRRGWSQAELARQLGVDRSTLVHARSGQRWYTAGTIARISRLFGDVPELKDLIWTFLRYEYPVGAEEKGILALPTKRRTGLPEDATETIRRYVRSFPMRLVDGRGLIVTATSARMLSLAAREIEDSLTASGVRVHRRAAHGSPGPTEAEAIARSRLLVLERIDGGGEVGARLLASQLASERPVVVTSAKDIDTVVDEQIARQLHARATLLAIEAPCSVGDA